MNYELATLKQRFLAGLIDLGLILAIYLFLMGTAISSQQWGMVTVFQLLVIALAAAYSIYFTADKRWQGTFGKRIMGIRVVSVDGQTLSLQQSSVRFVVSWISGFFMGIGHLLMIVDKKKRAVHDLSANSLVIV
jgi:uncharacterized RDD family membrane protein YckC